MLRYIVMDNVHKIHVDKFTILSKMMYGACFFKQKKV